MEYEIDERRAEVQMTCWSLSLLLQFSCAMLACTRSETICPDTSVGAECGPDTNQ
jgi:hypothetical protein